MTDPVLEKKLASTSIGPMRTRTAILAVLVVLQSLAAVFFVADAFADVTMEELTAHSVFEAFVAIMLVIGVVLGGIEMRRMLDRTKRVETALAAASGALAEVIEAYFTSWKLTPAESEVAMLALKGFDIAEIATLREAAPGTVRAQLTRIYAKADVSSRAQFVSLFVEDLLGGPVDSGA